MAGYQQDIRTRGFRKVIRVIPTLSTDAYADNDVLFDSTEIPNAVSRPGGTSSLVRIEIHNHLDTTLDMDLVFTENQANLGTINEDAGTDSLWTETLAKASNLLGHARIDMSDSEIDLVNSLLSSTNLGAPTIGATSQPAGSRLFLQAAENSTSVYFAGMDRTGGLTFGANDLEFIFHIEY